MNTQYEGQVEFRETKIGPWWRRSRIIEYRQCFKGIWGPWKAMTQL